SVGRERGVEFRHVDDCLGVLSLTDGQVERHRVAPPARAVRLVVVINGVRPERPLLIGKIDSALVSKSKRYAAGNHARQPDLQPQLVEVHVARHLDGTREGYAALPLLVPAFEVAVSILKATSARHWHLLGQRDQPIFQARDRGGELERRARRIATLGHLVDQRAPVIGKQTLPVVSRYSTGELVDVVAWRAVQ